MKRKIFPLIIIFSFIITAVMIFAYTGVVSGTPDNKTMDDKIDLEDAIIIRELKMSSDTGVDDGESGGTHEAGRILYDDDFSREIGDGSTGTVPLMEKLRKKNARWHLTGYRIKKNDNLWNIASRFRVDHRLIIEANSITHPDMLLPGKSIKVPNINGMYHAAKDGDTLKNISARYKCEAEKIVSVNRNDYKTIKKGARIFIPDYTAPKEAPENRVTVKKSAGEKGEHLSFMWPITGKMTSGFGARKDPFSDKSQFHNGIDISADIGKKIKAAAPGKVIFSGWQVGYGNMVILKHDHGFITVYAHNSKNLAGMNDVVKKGDVIALTGMTGAVTGAHLHFEIRKYVTALNPLRLLK